MRASRARSQWRDRADDFAIGSSVLGRATLSATRGWDDAPGVSAGASGIAQHQQQQFALDTLGMTRFDFTADAPGFDSCYQNLV
jgi:hypothetical protein